MKLRIQAYSDKGRIRDGNEDMLSVAGIPVRDGNLERDFDVTGDDYFCLFVADGMGGHEKGGVVWYLGRVFLLNAGYSRTYHWRDGLLTQLATDETERGLTGSPEASKLLLNCIGGGSKGNVKVEDITDRLLEGDMLLICSDGLTDMVPDEEIERILAEDMEPAMGLIERARDNGGEGNVSAIVAMVGDYDFAPGPYDDDYPEDDGRFDAWV